ncbi:sensor histidine kinase [Anaerocolumna sp. MB42-C2]|uniref:sensor histidine kinase n=1 Tax=Anaerocolumna sp. MB42-C2 TaxID=3070997 RepID=UPI0027E0356C|nr:HAMP domain-containing sensor histidine kinase [Anaerocolumna sp. MB42-C2]WMJ87199.1 HAMP domain-containing sensor histidine kinase [Anaerocolumna sp. MB42-C2]
MKYRTFLTTLILFLFTFNLGIFIISITSFQDTVNRSKEGSLGEHYFITSAILKDFNAVESRGVSIESTVNSLLTPYRYLTGNNKALIALYKNNELVYSDLGNITVPERFLKLPEDENRLISLQKTGKNNYIIVSGKMPAPYNSYIFVYLYDMTEAINSWEKMKNMLYVIGFLLSALLALGLHALLNRIFRPLAQISHISGEIAAGAYETRLPVLGQDELSDMVRSFNHMAEEIQKQMTELITAAEKKQQFIDNFAHELRTPLTAIYGYAEYLQKAAVTEEDQLSSTQYIMSESRRLQTMAYQLLELANLKNDQIVWETVSVPGVFELIRHTLDSKFKEKDIQTKFLCELDTVRGDACLLESLVLNLADNAVKACSQGGHITVGAGKEEENKMIYIQDDGKGMTQEVLNHITEPFYRAEKSRNRKDGGAGLGLALCTQIAVCHGARLTFESYPEKGTTAKIIFTTST